MPSGKRKAGAAAAAVAAEIRVLAARRRLNQKDLSERTGISRTTMSRIWNGSLAVDVEQLSKLCAALDVEPSELLAAAVKESEVVEAAYEPPQPPGSEGEVQP